MILKFLTSVLFLASMVSVQAAQVLVAVASNFTAPMQKIAQLFEIETGHKVLLSFGSTGSFYAQIKHGGPFQLFLAADHQTPALLEKEGLGVAGTRWTYAVGQLVLWSKQSGMVDGKGDILQSGKFQKIALAHPKLAPYGAAAVEVMRKLGVLQQLQPKWVLGENIAQTYQFIHTENAQLGFVALSQIYTEGKLTPGSTWVVPGHLYSPIQQDGILLNAGQNEPAALALLAFLKSDQAKALIKSYGYTD